PDQLDEQRAAAGRLSYRPLLSVVMPSGDPEGDPMRGTIASVRSQTYDRWELCVASGAEDAAASARGDYVAFLDPGDLLAPFALYEIAGALERDPELDVLYSDRDTISEETNVRTDPLFTPEWSPELLLSAGYMSHLLVVRRDAMREAGGIRPGLGPEQLWDLSLRLSERTQRIARVPKVLYHRRSEHLEPREGRAVREHLERTGRNGSVEGKSDGSVRIRWEVRGDPPVSLIIPTRHNRPLLERCLSGIERASYANREILVVETAPRETDREAWYEELSRKHPVKVLWWERPFNYSAVNNWAAAQASGDILLFLNDDTEAIGEDWLTELVGWAQQEEIGAVGAQLLNEDGTIQHGGIVVGLTGFAGQLFKFLRPGDGSLLGLTMWYRNVLAVTGACLAMRREVFDKIGGWDERYLLAGSDVELGLRLRRAGYRVVCTPFAQLRHREQATRGSEIPQQDFVTSFEDYREFLNEGDPYFSPNLSYDATIPTLTTGDYSPMQTASAIIEASRSSLSERA
ncbi:MAG: glycosyltransferase family 2 protein, partial [Actinomycetota bacterium]